MEGAHQRERTECKGLHLRALVYGPLLCLTSRSPLLRLTVVQQEDIRAVERRQELI